MPKAKNPHALRDAGNRGAAEGRKASKGKSYKANPYNPAFISKGMKKSGARIAAQSLANQKSWNERFEANAGFRWKKYEKPNKHATTV